ncbi:MAG: tyrosine-type recombinase/integrase [Elusimicrobiota bacterium]
MLQNNRTINIRDGKGGKDRVVPLTKVSAGYLREYINKVRPKLQKNGNANGTVFLNLNGREFDRQGLCRLILRYAKVSRISKPVTAHILRHSIATHLLENGMSIRYIQEFLGHKSLGTTQQYTKVTIEDLRNQYNKYHPKERRKN